MKEIKHTFADAAYVVLFENRNEIHYKELARLVLERGLFSSKGKTPEQTLRSQVAREVTQKGDESRFVNRDAGIIGLSTWAKANPDRVLIATVIETSGVSATEAKAKAEAITGGADRPSDPSIAARSQQPFVPAGGSDDPAKILAPSAPAAAPAASPAPSRGEPSLAAAPAVGGSGGDLRYVPVVLEGVAKRIEEEEAFLEDSGTFASAGSEPIEHAAPGDLAEDDGQDPGPISRRTQAEDSDQDFLSVGAEIRDMATGQYEASMEELAPIVVPPHEGGAAEIARIPRGNRSVLIVKVVRRQDQPVIQLVEELESLVSGLVGRLLLTLPGDQLDDLLDALTTVRRVVDHSFPREEDDAPRTRRGSRHD